MATRKDQLDAFVFARRRMVSNLVAPSPTGSDEAAPRPVKTFFTSAILSAIAVAGVAVLGVFRPSAPSGWETGLAVDGSGSSYVYSPQDKELHPIMNTTSAKLLLGSKFKKFDVPDSTINGSLTIGAPLGIPGAPSDVPTAGNVDLTQWNLCLQSKSATDQTVAGGKTLLEIGYPGTGEQPVTPGTGFVVHDSSNVNYLITGDYAYPVPDPAVLATLTNASVGPTGTEGPWVSSAWLRVFAQGTALQYPTLDGIGDQTPGSLSNQPSSRIGDYGSVTATNGTNETAYYVETGTGLVQVSLLMYTLYTASPAITQHHVEKREINSSQVGLAHPQNELKDASPSFGQTAADWPQSTVATLDTDGVGPSFGVFCVGYTAGSFGGNVAHLSLSYGTALPPELRTNAGVVQAGGSSYADSVLVKPGHGALARDVSGGNSQMGPEYLITDTGTRYQMAPASGSGQTAQPSAAQMLQYDKVVTVRRVPDSWMRLIQVGATLDPQAAGQTPSLIEQ